MFQFDWLADSLLVQLFFINANISLLFKLLITQSQLAINKNNKLIKPNFRTNLQ